MIGGKIINGRKVYRENSETYPTNDGFIENNYKEVVDFFLDDEEINNMYLDIINGKSNKLFDRTIKSNDKFSFEPFTEVGHIKLNIDENGEYTSLKECFFKAKSAQYRCAEKYIFDSQDDIVPYDKIKYEICLHINLRMHGENHLQNWREYKTENVFSDYEDIPDEYIEN